MAEQKVRIASFPVGDAMVELTQPLAEDSPLSKFLEKRGEGIHHIALEVDDVVKELARLKAEGFQLIDEQPRTGSHGMIIAFLHPKSTNGVLIELCNCKDHPPALDFLRSAEASGMNSEKSVPMDDLHSPTNPDEFDQIPFHDR